jgi:TatD DNase family protein
MEIIDTHAHLDRFHERGELNDVLARADAVGVKRIINIGTDTSDWTLYQQLGQQYPGKLYRTAGLHPCHVDQGWEGQLAQLEPALDPDGALVGLGECGLDYFRLSKANREAEVANQQQAFREQIRIALRHDLPLIIHSRSAFEDTLRLLQEEKFPFERTVFHCFAEGPEEITELNRRGGRASFTAIPTFPKSDRVRAALKAQPLDLLMIETDCPYLAPQIVRGQTNEPAFLAHTALWIADAFGLSVEELAARTTAAAEAFFQLVRRAD